MLLALLGFGCRGDRGPRDVVAGTGRVGGSRGVELAGRRTRRGAWWVLVAVALLLLHFPDGSLPSPRWRWVPPALVVCAAAEPGVRRLRPVGVPAAARGAGTALPRAAGVARRAQPGRVRPAAGPVPGLRCVPGRCDSAGADVANACSDQVGRHRRDRGAALPGAVPGGDRAVGTPFWFSAAVGLVALVGIPLSTAVAILRHDLYDVDKALSGTVTWALLTAVLVGPLPGDSPDGRVLVGRGSELVGRGRCCRLRACPATPAWPGAARQSMPASTRCAGPRSRRWSTLHHEVSAGQRTARAAGGDAA